MVLEKVLLQQEQAVEQLGIQDEVAVLTLVESLLAAADIHSVEADHIPL